ncbi:MAG: hypothetical protein ACLFVJ_15700 [Persicimonas sp.]
MTQRLEDLVQFEKSIGKTVKKQLKGLRKSAKKARKKSDRELTKEEARGKLDEVMPLLARHADTAAARASGDADTRVDLVVDGEILVEDVPVQALVVVRKQVKRLRKLGDELALLHGEDDFVKMGDRARRLQAALDAAIREANATQVAEREISPAIIEYLRGGA